MDKGIITWITKFYIVGTTMVNLELGDRMKFYEKNGFNSIQLIPNLPFVVRLDGKAFHSFTSNLKKPYCFFLNNCFAVSALETLEEFGAKLSYQQSDEVSLFFYYPDYKSEIVFGGKIFKLTSVICSFFTATFNSRLKLYSTLEKKTAIFDARVIQLPSLEETYNYYLWRYRDCVKNSISSLASQHFSHKQLEGLNQSKRKDLLYSEKGISWEDQAPSFKNGNLMSKNAEIDTSLDLEEFKSLLTNAK